MTRITSTGDSENEPCQLHRPDGSVKSSMPRNRHGKSVHHHDTVPKGVPTCLLDSRSVSVVYDDLSNEGNLYARVLDCGIVRYVLVVKWNVDVVACTENALLEEMYDAVEKGGYQNVSGLFEQCTELFWPFIREDYERRSQDETITSNDRLAFERTCVVKMQLKTVNGSFGPVEPDPKVVYHNRLERNPVQGVASFSKSLVSYSRRIHNFAYLVTIMGIDYCLKLPRIDCLEAMHTEVRKLHKVSQRQHPNVVNLGGLLESGDEGFEGMLLSFIPGSELSKRKEASLSEKTRWKKEITSAVHFLHSIDVVWGDASPWNILIDERSNRAVLIDFEGGYTKGWVDSELAETKEGDLQALERITSFIDELRTC